MWKSSIIQSIDDSITNDFFYGFQAFFLHVMWFLSDYWNIFVCVNEQKIYSWLFKIINILWWVYAVDEVYFSLLISHFSLIGRGQ